MTDQLTMMGVGWYYTTQLLEVDSNSTIAISFDCNCSSFVGLKFFYFVI